MTKLKPVSVGTPSAYSSHLSSRMASVSSLRTRVRRGRQGGTGGKRTWCAVPLVSTECILPIVLVQTEVTVPCDHAAYCTQLVRPRKIGLCTHLFVGGESPHSHSMVVRNSASPPVFDRSPACRSTSPSGTANVRACMSEMHTKRVHTPGGVGGGTAEA
jgi:hypothetical protein